MNNAADDRRYPFDKITPEVWEWSIRSEPRKHVVLRPAGDEARNDRGGRGSIINFGSIAWMIMLPELAPYSASKAAMHGMSRSLAKEFRVRTGSASIQWSRAGPRDEKSSSANG